METAAAPETATLTPANGIIGATPAPAASALAPTTGQMPIAAPVTAPEPAPAPAKSYVVKKGDSLWKIASAEKVSMAELAKANNLTKTSVLQIGQKLTIPAAATAPAAPAAAATTTGTGEVTGSGQTYAVKAGDSLWKIAHNNNISVSALKQANGLTSDALKIGQKLTIPAPATASTVASPATASTGIAAGTVVGSTFADYREPGTYTENGQTVHYLDNGESLATLAKKYGVKAEDIMKANNITDPRRLNFGQRIVIPSGAPSASLANPAATITTARVTDMTPMVTTASTGR